MSRGGAWCGCILLGLVSLTCDPVRATPRPGFEATQSTLPTPPISPGQSEFSVLARKPQPSAPLTIDQLTDPGPCLTRESNPAELTPGPTAINRAALVTTLDRCLEQLDSEHITPSAWPTHQAQVQHLEAQIQTTADSIDAVNAQILTLEQQQFSPTTTLSGSLIMAADDILLGNFSPPTAAPTGPGLVTNLTLGYRTRLVFDTSFAGTDLLRIRIQAANFPNYARITDTNMARLSFDSNTDGLVEMNALFYRFRLTPQTTFSAEIVSGAFDHSFKPYNPLLSSSEKGTISRFGRFNPIYDIKGGTGFLLVQDLITRPDGTGITFNLGYLAGRSGNSGDSTCSASQQNPCFNSGYPGSNPLFNAPTGGLTGTYGAMTQLDLRLSPDFSLGLNYVRSFGLDISGGSGSTYAQNPFGSSAATNFRNNQADSVGLQFTSRFIQRLQLSGWVGYSHVRAAQGEAMGQTADVLNYALTLGVRDLRQQGDVLGMIIGQPPQLLRTDNPTRPAAFSSYHLEGFYRLQLTPHIALTPGLVVVLHPNSNTANPPLLLGVMRTTFNF